MIKKYDHFIILEKYDDNIKAELMKIGVSDKDELEKLIRISKKGYLAAYLNSYGKKFTFGLLKAIFNDAIIAKKNTSLKSGFIKMTHRVLPMILAPFFPIAAIIGLILGASRAINKIIMPILDNPGKNYSGFLKKIIISSMKVAEGDIEIKDRFMRAFVVSDNILSILKPSILEEFSIYLSEKMSNESDNKEVPEYYVENELKTYLNEHYNIDPKIPLKNKD